MFEKFLGITAILFLCSNCNNSKITELHINVPFVFSEHLDNKDIQTVGDQMLAEHLFAYHQNQSWKHGTQELFSKISPDYTNNTLTIVKNRELKDHTGQVFSFDKVCASIKNSLQGTLHAQYSELVNSITCSGKSVVIYFKTIPNNWRSLFASPDFAITDNKTYTGPYFIKSADQHSAHLKINTYYPTDLRSNNISDVAINSYAASDSPKMIEQLSPKKDHATFFYGHVLHKKDLDTLRNKKFNLQIFQNEWLVYVGFSSAVSLDDRITISALVDKERPNLQNFAELGTPAYSLAPSDRSWGLDELSYQSLQKNTTHHKVKRKYSIATLDEWASLPLFAKVLDLLKSNFDFEVRLYSRKEMGKIYDKGADLFISPVGVSPDDPVGHLYFFSSRSDEYSKVLNANNDLVKIATLKDTLLFDKALREMEMRIARNKLIIPLFHYPSVIAESPELEKDPKLSWDWGIQTWAYQIH